MYDRSKVQGVVGAWPPFGSSQKWIRFWRLFMSVRQTQRELRSVIGSHCHFLSRWPRCSVMRFVCACVCVWVCFYWYHAAVKVRQSVTLFPWLLRSHCGHVNCVKSKEVNVNKKVTVQWPLGFYSLQSNKTQANKPKSKWIQHLLKKERKYNHKGFWIKFSKPDQILKT